jgi:hypothetical protein
MPAGAEYGCVVNPLGCTAAKELAPHGENRLRGFSFPACGFAAFTMVAPRNWLCSIVMDTTYPKVPNRSPGRGTMVDRIRNIMARFPENEDVVRKLILQNRDFDALCQEYSQTSEEMEKLAAETGQVHAAETDELAGRRRTIEEEILTLIEGYSPA